MPNVAASDASMSDVEKNASDFTARMFDQTQRHSSIKYKMDMILVREFEFSNLNTVRQFATIESL